jgi:hypothetical protein
MQEPFQRRYYEIMDCPAYLQDVLREGEEAAGAVAQQTLEWTKEAMGLHIPSWRVRAQSQVPAVPAMPTEGGATSART